MHQRFANDQTSSGQSFPIKIVMYFTLCAVACVAAAFVGLNPLARWGGLLKPTYHLELSLAQPLTNTNLRELEQRSLTDFRLNLKSQFKPRLNGKYQNLFQTARYNFGIRFELSPDGQAALLIPQRDEPIAISLGALKEGATYDLELYADSERVEIAVNGRKEEHHLSSAAPAFDEIRVGIGYDDTRPFVGEITEFKMSVDAFQYGRFWNKVFRLGRAILFASCFVFAGLAWRELLRFKSRE